MNENQKQLTLIECWNEIQHLYNELDLYRTLRDTKGDIGSPKLKEIMTNGGNIKSDIMLNNLIAKDDYTSKINEIIKSINAYETYMINEQERLKLSQPALVIAFMRDYKKMGWKKVSYEMHYCIKQCKRYYDEYKRKY